MKIAIDLRPLQIGHENRGIGSYLLNIIEYFPKEDTEYVFLRYNSSNPIVDYGIGAGRKYDEVILKKHKYSRKPKDIILFGLSLIAPKFTKIKKLKPDVFFQTDYLLGLPRSRSIKNVVVAYDLIPFKFKNLYMPSWHKYSHQKQFKLRTRVKFCLRAYYYEKKYYAGVQTLNRANSIISISKTTTNDLVEIADIDISKIHTIYLAPSFRDKNVSVPSKKVKAVINPIKKNYLLFIGGTDPRRLVHELVYAFNQLNARGKDIDLVFAGNEFVIDGGEISTLAKNAIESSSYNSQIHLLGKISEADKYYILNNAYAFVYPTLYEGFGLPILEAMGADCPVITFKNPATREIAEDSAIYTDSPDGVGIFDSTIELLTNEKTRKNIIELGKQRAKQFNWQSTGDSTIKIILDV